MPRTPLATISALHDAYRRGAWRPSKVVEHWPARQNGSRTPPVWISTSPASVLRERARVLDMPPKPGMVRTGTDGRAIAVEIWEMPLRSFGGFVAGVPSPLSIGTIELDDGTFVQGFLCEASATTDAEDISRFGGWRNYLSSRSVPSVSRAKSDSNTSVS